MIVPLSSLMPGERGVVVNISGGPGMRGRLVSMGITPGATVQVLESYAVGPIIVSVGGVRFAVGRRMASKILVKKI